MTSPGLALGRALRDLYGNSWRLVPVNAALGAVLVAVGMAAAAVHAAAVLVVLAGPLAAALAHASVRLVRTGTVTLADAGAGLRLHWRRGATLAAAAGALLLLGVLAVRVYAQSVWAWPLAFLAVYVVVLAGTYLTVLGTLAVAEPERPLRELAVEAARRPGATIVLGLALLGVNAAGVAAAVMPFLTVTIAYSFLVVAHFALPAPSTEELA